MGTCPLHLLFALKTRSTRDSQVRKWNELVFSNFGSCRDFKHGGALTAVEIRADRFEACR